MTRTSKSLIVFLVAALGVWGCAQGPTQPSTAHAERVRALEAKCVKLEDDYRAVVNLREQARKEAANLVAVNARLEKDRQQLQKELDAQKAIAQERDQLRQAVESRTTERDAWQSRCDRLKKGLQSLIGQDDAQLPTSTSTSPVSVVPGPVLGGQS